MLAYSSWKVGTLYPFNERPLQIEAFSMELAKHWGMKAALNGAPFHSVPRVRDALAVQPWISLSRKVRGTPLGRCLEAG